MNKNGKHNIIKQYVIERWALRLENKLDDDEVFSAICTKERI